MSATEDPEDLESIEERRRTLKLVFDYLRPFIDGSRVRAKRDATLREMIGDVEPAGWRRLYRWPVKVVVLLGLLVAAALVVVWFLLAWGMLLLLVLVSLSYLLLSWLPPFLGVSVCIAFFGVVAGVFYVLGSHPTSEWYLRVASPLALLATVWIGGTVMIWVVDDSLTGAGLVEWTIVDSIPLIDLDRLLALEQPLDDWSASVGWVLVLVRVGVLTLLVRVVVVGWRWAHSTVGERGLASVVSQAASELRMFFDAPLSDVVWALRGGSPDKRQT